MNPKLCMYYTYRKVRAIPLVKVKNGTFDLLNVQYQVAKVDANIISPNPSRKNIHQKNATTSTAENESNYLKWLNEK